MEPEKNGVHIRGLLLHARSAAHSGTYLLRYLARKLTTQTVSITPPQEVSNEGSETGRRVAHVPPELVSVLTGVLSQEGPVVAQARACI